VPFIGCGAEQNKSSLLLLALLTDHTVMSVIWADCAELLS